MIFQHDTSEFDHTRVLLGKERPLKLYAAVPIHIKDYLEPEQALTATKIPWAYGAGVKFGMFGNDSKSDCTCAAFGHAVQAMSMRAGNPEAPTDADVLELYHSTGVEQHLSDNDGRYMYGVLTHLSTVGFGGDHKKILGFAAVDHTNHDEVLAAGSIFGGIYFGAALSTFDGRQISAGKMWTTHDGPDDEPGSWGGHCMYEPYRGRVRGTSATWARRQGFTTGWWDKKVDEAYVILTQEWTQNKVAPNGLDLQTLLDDLAELRS